MIWILISLCTGAVRHLYYNNCYTHANEGFFAFHKVVCAATLFRQGGWVYNFLVWIFLIILCSTNYQNWIIFCRVIQNIKRGTFSIHSVHTCISVFAPHAVFLFVLLFCYFWIVHMQLSYNSSFNIVSYLLFLNLVLFRTVARDLWVNYCAFYSIQNVHFINTLVSL